MKTIFKIQHSLFIIAFLFIVNCSLSIAQTPVTIIAADSLVRPPNGTQYTANDVVNDSTTASNKILIFQTTSINSSGTGVVVNKGMGGIITGAVLTAGDSANTANGNFKLLLFRDTIPSSADNAAWATSAYFNALFLGEIDFALTNNGTTQNYSDVTGLSKAFQCASDDTKIYGVLLAKAAFTPAFRQKFIIKLFIVRN